jgi:ADP-dependent NAD(P)H-hydrate dehydratase / NAD(P)H-hydrate epimerase
VTLPSDAYPAAAIRQIEREAIAAGIPGYTLMQRAGAAALACLQRRWPGALAICVVAGTGNNGGDGLVLARLAHVAGLRVQVLVVGAVEAIRGEAAEALRDLRAAGLDLHAFDAARLVDCDVVIDALLGIGVRSPLEPAWLAAIEAINASGVDVLSLDMPSGLAPDSGDALPAVKARATITFLGLKQGLFRGDGPGHAGAIEFDALGTQCSPTRRDSFSPSVKLLDSSCIQSALRPRPRHSHKALFGRVVIVGGGAGMAGAVRMAAEAALRVGAGLVTVASRPEHLDVVVGARPELMFLGVESGEELAPALQQADVIAIGPGLGRSRWARELLQVVLQGAPTRKPLVLDADALNLIAAGECLRRDDWILTPHPGEAARLLGCSTAEVQADRFSALRQLAHTRGGIVVLKGASTLIGRDGEVPRLCTRGNPGMAVPGMGDVLTGAIAGFLAQCDDPLSATSAAVQAHAQAGDRCARQGVRGVLALDVAAELRDEAATDSFARRAARHLDPAAAPLVLHLRGDLGAGKTSVARGMLRALGESGPVRSPTYGLLSEYDTARGRVVHIDLYRLQSPAELTTLGLADHLPGSLLWLVEWPEKGAGGVMPPPDALMSLQVEGDGRRLHVLPITPAGSAWLAGICADSG